MNITKMTWEKRGIIFSPQNKFDWATNSALQPTPVVLDKVVKVFCGFRDDEGISRIGWVDLDKNDPSKVLDYSRSPVLDIGLPGCFDDNGLVPTAVVKRDNKLYLYYAGYQLVKNVRFLAFLGLAISDDNGLSFKRYSNVPILERTNKEFLFRVVHSIMFDNDTWRAWYGGGSHFMQGDKKTMPVYDIWYMESKDGIHFPEEGINAISTSGDEYRVGRPYVIKSEHGYEMFFGASSPTKLFRLAYAVSKDGINWTRDDEALGLEYSENEFDSEMSAYPAVFGINNIRYLLYNGNNYGFHGFGLAQIKK